MKNRICLVLLILTTHLSVFCETLYPVKILFENEMSGSRNEWTDIKMYKNELLVVKSERKEPYFGSPDAVYLNSYNIEDNTIHNIGYLKGKLLQLDLMNEESIIIESHENTGAEYYVYSEDKHCFFMIGKPEPGKKNMNIVPDVVSKGNCYTLNWTDIGDYFVKIETLFPEEDKPIIVIDKQGNIVNSLLFTLTGDDNLDYEYIKATSNSDYLFLHARLTPSSKEIDNRLIGNNKRLVYIIYKLISDDQVSSACTEVVDITEIPSDAEMPAYKVTTRTVDASSLIVPLKPDAKNLKASDNLRLRKTELTSSEIITTMLKGTPVKIIAIGRQETIDGITGNWVQVEVLPGGKDRNGNPIPTGTTGWCFGGYLE